jgi:hypothetical protein
MNQKSHVKPSPPKPIENPPPTSVATTDKPIPAAHIPSTYVKIFGCFVFCEEIKANS